MSLADGAVLDKELLAGEQDRSQERQWQASHGLARISLPTTSTATHTHARAGELRGQHLPYHTNNLANQKQMNNTQLHAAGLPQALLRQA